MGQPPGTEPRGSHLEGVQCPRGQALWLVGARHWGIRSSKNFGFLDLYPVFWVGELQEEQSEFFFPSHQLTAGPSPTFQDSCGQGLACGCCLSQTHFLELDDADQSNTETSTP